MLETSAILKQSRVEVGADMARRLEALLTTCRNHLPAVDEDMIRRAFELSYWAHRNDLRMSGERYITHPLAVAQIVAELIRIDDTSVAAALLHDVVEDTELSLGLVRAEFGDDMAMVIDGLTKISGVYSNRARGQAENVRKLILSMARDLRLWPIGSGFRPSRTSWRISRSACWRRRRMTPLCVG